MNRLRSCEGCLRHVLSTERACPFCERALSTLPERPVAKLQSGLSRAQRLALAAAVAGQASLSACMIAAEPLYGAPVPSGRGSPTGGSQGGTPGTVAGTGTGGAGRSGPPMGTGGNIAVPVYGAPLAGRPSPVIDAAPPDDDAGSTDAGASDAGPPRDAMVQPVYGAPIPLYGASPPAK